MLMILESCSVFMSLACMLVTLICVLFDFNSNRIPTMIALGGCALYSVFLAIAGQNMDTSTLQKYFALLIAFAIYVLVAYGDYKQAMRKKKKYERFMHGEQ